MASLPVLSNRDLTRLQIARELEQLVPGQVRFSQHERMLYATDASIYQVEPWGVVLPRDMESLQKVVRFCGSRAGEWGRGIPILPRGGGTSLPGQCTNAAVVVDYSQFCRGVLGIDAGGLGGGRCHVEPGITVDELNRHLDGLGTGLFFAPDPATAAQASIGGCIGNNAAGARSIRYGRTSENVAGLDILLSSGQRLWVGEAPENRVAEAAEGKAQALELARQVERVVRKYEPFIRARYPKTKRRNAGYALDGILQQLDLGITAEKLDLSGLICGSEGTLAFVLGANLKLHPVPQSKGLAILSFVSVDEAIAAVEPILQTLPSAVELLDDVVLEAARGNNECRGYMDLLAEVQGHPPTAILYVEYQEAGTPGEGGEDAVQARFAALQQLLPQIPMRTYLDKRDQLRAWALRKAGEPLLHGMAAERKPVTCVEDNAVPVENLVRFVAEFKRIVAKYGTKAAYYAHASVGVLHVRPLLDLHVAEDRDRLRAMAVEVADLAQACGGVMSGEHGDGRLRGPLLERFYGPELMQAFREIKAIFDPAGIFNPGNIVNAGPVESITENLRIRPVREPDHGARDLQWPAVPSYFDLASGHGGGGIGEAVEMCSGAGVCRKTGGGGVMCPSYRATLDERHSTRGRANALRLALTGQFTQGNPNPWNDPETMETLSLCLSCKACKTECPSNVDVAKLKAEYTAQRYRTTGHIPLQAWAFGQIRLLNQLGALVPGVANRVANWGPVRGVMNRSLGLAPERSLPAFAPSLYRWFAGRPKRPSGNKPRVVLFADCFVTYNEPEIGRQAVQVLEALGYQVELPKVGCCGRSMISNGMLAEAIKAADRVLGQLAAAIADPAVKAIIVCEPSCLSAMRDDWLQLKLQTPLAVRQRLAEKALLAEEFVERYWHEHPIPPRVKVAQAGGAGGAVVYHGHCHQKALWGQETSQTLLRRLVGERLQVLPSGCCGMAGGFGYTKKNYELSMKIGEQSLFSLLREVPAEARVVAAGTSCRHQIKDGTGRKAVHPISLLAEYLDLGQTPAD